MNHQIDEINEAIQTISRNMLLLATDASPTLRHIVDQSSMVINDFAKYHFEQIKEAFKP